MRREHEKKARTEIQSTTREGGVRTCLSSKELCLVHKARGMQESNEQVRSQTALLQNIIRDSAVICRRLDNFFVKGY